MCRLSWNLGASTSWNPQGLSKPVMGLLCLFYMGLMKFSRLIVEPAVVQHSAFKVEMTIETLKSYKSRENGQIQAHLIQAEAKQYDPWSINILILSSIKTNSLNSGESQSLYWYIYTGCPRRNVPDFGRVFLMLKYTDITQNTYIQSWTGTEIMAREKCGLLVGPRTVPVSWQVLSMFVLEFGVGFSSH